MRPLARWLLLFVAAGLFPAAGLAQTCTATDKTHAVSIGGDSGVRLMAGQSHVEPFGPGWVFKLMPQALGWSIRVYENDQAGAVDLTAMTPPQRSAPNPRDIYGWHFRNADNTGPNAGEVNAPQDMRIFYISPGLAGTGGYKPSHDPAEPALSAPDLETDGLGWLKILDYGLADLNPGEQARMVYIAFNACLNWPKTEDEIQREADLSSPVYTPEDIETFGDCGLDMGAYALNAAITPRILGGDFDNDGAHDQAAQIVRKADGARGLAICLAGTWLDLAGITPGPAMQDLPQDYISKMEAWRVLPPDHDPLGFEDAPEWPDAAGDLMALERIEKELVLIYWASGAFRSQHVYHFVEP